MVGYGCTKNSEVHSFEEIQFSELQIEYSHSFQLVSNNQLGKTGIYYTTDPKTGNILLSDQTNQRLLVYTNTGDLVQTYGERGFGPGEFERIYSFTFDDESGVVAIDMAKMNVLWFHPGGELKIEFDLESGFNIMPQELFFRDNKLFVPVFESELANVPKESALFLVYNADGQLLEQAGMHQNYAFPIIASTYVSDSGTYSYHIIRNSYTIYKTDLNNNSVQMAGYKPKWFNELTDDIAYGVNREEAMNASLGKSFSSLFGDGYYIYHIYTNLTEDWFRTTSIMDRGYYLVKYDNNLNYIGELKLEYPPVFISNSYVYFLTDEDPDNISFSVYTFNN